MSKTLSLPSAKSARPRRRQTKPSRTIREDGRLSHPSKPVSMIASTPCSCPAGPRTIKWMIAWRSSVTTPVIMLRVIVGRIRSGARTGSRFASTIPARLEPDSEDDLRQLVHPRLSRRLRFRYRSQRICPHCPFLEWREAHNAKSHPLDGQTPLCCNEVDFSFRYLLSIGLTLLIYTTCYDLAKLFFGRA